ncbi:MAG: hypothetical protein Q7R76_04645 [Candidatus Woesearchaeota archaeon]|nr:hypothetical protein [Candidatus Woesearchaeota archaeon]
MVKATMRFHNGRLTMANSPQGSQSRVAFSGKDKQRLISGKPARGKEVMGEIEFHTWGSGTKARFPVLKKITSVEDM